MKTCQYCGEENPSERDTCTRCGKYLASSVELEQGNAFDTQPGVRTTFKVPVYVQLPDGHLVKKSTARRLAQRERYASILIFGGATVLICLLLISVLGALIRGIL